MHRYNGVYIIFVHKRDTKNTFVSESAGNDAPIKKPKTTPTNVVTISLMVSLDFLTTVLLP